MARGVAAIEAVVPCRLYAMSEQQKVMSLAERRAETAARYLRGDTQAAIAADLGVSQQQISKDLNAIRKEWLASAIRDFDEAKSQELAKIDLVEVEYWRAWTRSQEDKEITYSETGGKFGGKSGERREGQAGNPAFLDGVLKCIERRCKILGIDAPERQELSGPGGTPLLPSIREVVVERPVRDPE